MTNELPKRPSVDHLLCSNCQTWIEPIDGHTPHIDRDTQAFSCEKHPDVVDPLSGARSDVQSDNVDGHATSIAHGAVSQN